MTINNIQENVTWWEKFYQENIEDEGLEEIFAKIEEVDDDTTEKSIMELSDMIKTLDVVKYKEAISNFNRRLRIFEKRMERQVSVNLGLALKRLRENKGLSLSKLGDLTGVSASYINRIELGQRKAPSFPIIEKIANVLNVPAHSLLNIASGDEDVKAPTITEVLYASNISITEDGTPMTSAAKEQLIEIIEFITSIKWKDNKHTEMLKLIQMLDEFK